MTSFVNSKKVTIIVLILFSWFTFSYAYTVNGQEETLEEKVLKYFYDGNYDGAIDFLNKYIKEIINIKKKRIELAEAYYHLAKTFYKVGLDDQARGNLKEVYKAYPKFEKKELDSDFLKMAKGVQKDVLLELEQAKAKELTKDKTEVKPKEEAKKDPVDQTQVKKDPVQKTDKPKTDTKEKVQDIKQEEKKPVIKKKTTPIASGIKTKEGEKKKKKFPVLIVVLGVVAVGVIIALMMKKGNDPEEKGPEGPNNFDTEELGIEWIRISEGEFEMGDNFNEGDPDERPVHTVFLNTYQISKYEVTFDQYDRFCDETSRPKPNDEGWGRGNRPVIHVTWNDANDFCAWLSDKTRKNIHLPTEAQWEKAARGKNQRRFPWGNSAPNALRCNFKNILGKTRPVGSYALGISPYGAHDMAGNVWEWCADWYGKNYYSNSPERNPEGPPSGSYRVFRGGSWDHSADGLRSASRCSGNPPSGEYDLDFGGFRIARND